MKQTFLEIDLVMLLDLEKTMTAVEINELTSELNKEIWHRLLNEEVKKEIGEKEYKKLLDKFSIDQGLDPILDYIIDHYRIINIRYLLEKVSASVKQEFIKRYLEELLEDYKKDKKIELKISQMIMLIKKTKLDEEQFKKIFEETQSQIKKLKTG